MTQALQNLGILALGSRFRVLSEAMMATVKSFYEDNSLDFEPRWFPLFRTVFAKPGIGMMALSQQLGVSHANVNAFSKQLLDADLITLTPDRADARIKQVTLTDKGRVLHTRLEPAWFVLQNALETAFPGETATQILAMVARLEEAVDDKAVPRALKSVLKSDEVMAGLEILPYDPANPDHGRYFAALNIEWLDRYFTVEPVDYTMFADPVATIIAPGGCIYMAAVRGQIVGTCALIKRGDIYELGKMAVSAIFQGKGIGTVLVGRIEDHARSLGLKTLYLVSSTKLPHAVPTYRKLGWVDCDNGLHEIYARADISLQKAL